MQIIPIFDVPTTAQTFVAAINTLEEWSHDSSSHRYVSTCAVYNLMLAQENPQIMQAMQGAAMITADGMPLVWLQRRWGMQQAERVYGPDIMEALAKRNLKHYFWGGWPDVAEKLSEKLATRFPDIAIVGAEAPPSLALDEIEIDHNLVKRINASGANILWVGLGSPKQDVWMEAYRPYLKVPLMIGVGAAFDILAGTKPQAPLWMQTNGLEWLFRLASEPRRLAKRYLLYNSLFLWKLLWHKRHPKV